MSSIQMVSLVVFALVALALIFGSLFVVYCGYLMTYTLVRRKGYKSPLQSLLVGLTCLVGWFAIFGFVIWTPGLPRSAPYDAALATVALVVLSGALLMTLIARGALTLLPVQVWAGRRVLYTCLACFLASLVLLETVLFWPRVDKSDPYNLGFVTGAFLVFCWSLLLVLAAQGAVSLAPDKNPRRSGARRARFPYGPVGWTLNAICALAVGYAALDWIVELPGDGEYYGFKLLQLLFPFGAYCVYLARRAEAPTLEEIVARDGRPPVLYLRSFHEEDLPFVELPGYEMESYTTLYYLHGELGPTFEQYFSQAITESIGPFIALGNPEDYLPPEGATRTYADDRDWKDQFRRFAGPAACILVRVSRSENLRWELGWLKRRGLQTKLFILTPPRERERSVPKRLRLHVARKVATFQRKLQGQETTPWAEFASVLRQIGYGLTPEEPPEGSVLTFDRKSDARRVASGALEPADFATAIRRWIAEHRGPRETAPPDSEDHGTSATR